MSDTPEIGAATPDSASLFDRPLPPGYRDEIQSMVAVAPADPPRREGSILLFQLGNLRLALPTRVASAVAPVLHIARIPHRSGTVLLGLAAFRGDIVPCCSLHRILDMPETTIPQDAQQAESTAARMLMLEESPGRIWAVPIDGVLGIRLRTGDPIETTTPIAEQWVQASFRDDAGPFYLLDPEVLFRQITLATA